MYIFLAGVLTLFFHLISAFRCHYFSYVFEKLNESSLLTGRSELNVKLSCQLAVCGWTNLCTVFTLVNLGCVKDRQLLVMLITMAMTTMTG